MIFALVIYHNDSWGLKGDWFKGTIYQMKLVFQTLLACHSILNIYVVVNFLSQVIFIFPLFFGMVIYANEFKTKEKQKLPEIKNSCMSNMKSIISSHNKHVFSNSTTNHSNHRDNN